MSNKKFDAAASLQLDRIVAELDDVRSQPDSADRDRLLELGNIVKGCAERKIDR